MSVFSVDRSGLYAMAAPSAQLEAAARAAGLAWLQVNLAGVSDKQGLLRAVAAALEFPPDFGANWDALADYLEDLSWQRAAGYVLAVRHAAPVAAACPVEWRLLLDIVRNAATYWREQGKPFIVLVEGLTGLPAFAA